MTCKCEAMDGLLHPILKEVLLSVRDVNQDPALYPSTTKGINTCHTPFEASFLFPKLSIFKGMWFPMVMSFLKPVEGSNKT